MDRDRGVALARAVLDGDPFAMNDLLDHLAAYVGRICASIALDCGPDAVQETLIAVFRGLPRLRDPQALYGWVRAIAVREALRVARQRAGAVPAELDELPAPGDPHLAADIRDVLDRLSPEYRAALVLRDVEGLDEKEVARLLDIAPGTVKSRLSRARASFRRAWTS